MFFFFKQKTAYELRISDWSSDVCSSDLYLTAATYFATFYGQLAEQRLGREWVPPTVALLLIPADKRAAFEAKEIVQAVRLLGLLDQPRLQNRSEERRVGKECVRTCRSRWTPLS